MSHRRAARGHLGAWFCPDFRCPASAVCGHLSRQPRETQQPGRRPCEGRGSVSTHPELVTLCPRDTCAGHKA